MQDKIVLIDKEYWGYKFPNAWCKECGCNPCKYTNVIFVKEIR